MMSQKSIVNLYLLLRSNISHESWLEKPGAECIPKCSPELPREYPKYEGINVRTSSAMKET